MKALVVLTVISMRKVITYNGLFQSGQHDRARYTRTACKAYEGSTNFTNVSTESAVTLSSAHYHL
jgi:hypothetical protein